MLSDRVLALVDAGGGGSGLGVSVILNSGNGGTRLSVIAGRTPLALSKFAVSKHRPLSSNLLTLGDCFSPVHRRRSWSASVLESDSLPGAPRDRV